MKREALTLSIVIPVYNEESYLKNCLDSIAAQEIMPREVIVVDNNSRDDSVKIAKSYPFVTVIHEKKQGIGHARNAGFDVVTSDIIGRIDADTVLPADWVKSMLEEYEKNPERAITGSGYFYDVPFKKVARLTHIFWWNYVNRLITGQYMLWGSNMAFPTKYWSIVKDQTSVDNAVAEDMDLSFLLHKHCPVVFIPRITTSNSLRSTASGVKSGWNYLRRWPESMKGHSTMAVGYAWIVVVIVSVLYTPFVLAMSAATRLRQSPLVRSFSDKQV